MESTIDNQNTENKIVGKGPLCPKCKVELAHRVKRGFLFKRILSWLPVKRYYCYKCKRKHYVWG